MSQETNKFIRSLTYDPRLLLSVNQSDSSESLPARGKNDKGVIICTNVKRSIMNEISEVSLLSPSDGVIFSGALVLANRNLAEGKPQAISLPMNEISVYINLPQLDEKHAIKTIKDPSNSKVMVAIDDSVNYWIKNVLPKGQDIRAEMSYVIKKMYSSMQTSTEIGLNIKSASAEVKNSFKFEKSNKKSVTMAMYKQVYFKAIVDLPKEPASIFSDELSVDDLKEVINNDNPPAYVKSVDYGRILLLRMETNSNRSKLELENTLKMVIGEKEIDVNNKNKYEEIANNSSFSVLILGGGAKVGSLIFEGNNFSEIHKVIKEGITVNEKNPVYPISYTVNFLKDNRHAIMPITTEYIESECTEYAAGYIKVHNNSLCTGNFTVDWIEKDDNGVPVPKSYNSKDKNKGFQDVIYMPGDSTDVHIIGKAAKFIKTWQKVIDKMESGPTNKTYQINGSAFRLRGKEINP